MLDSAPRAPKPQVAGSIPVPPALTNAEFLRAAGLEPSAISAGFDPVDPNGGNIDTLTTYAEPVIHMLVQQRLQ